MSTTLKGQVAIISGGLGDIGRAIALELARRGAHVAIGDIHDAAQAESLLGSIHARDVRSRYDRVDVSQAEAVHVWVDEVEKDLGLPSLIICNAAVGQDIPLDELKPDQWRRELAVDLDGAFYLAHAATQRLLRHRKRGRVVFIGSWAAHTVQRHIPAYCVSKAGLRMLCKCMAAELSPRGILVNEVAPGYVDAGVSRKYFEEHPGSRERALKTVPVLKLIKPEEVAEQVAYLCEPTNRHVTGTTLLLDGGLSLFGPGGRRDA